MSKLVGLFILFLAFPALAIVPVEGILLGVAREELQEDPLTYIFSDMYDQSRPTENRKLKFYHEAWTNGAHLNESCGLYGPMTYSSPWKEAGARRSVAATLQYMGLDLTVKAIGSYARKLEVSEEDYSRLADNLVNNYCSKNVTVFSLKTIKDALNYYYRNPLNEIIPSVDSSPFATEIFKYRTESTEARSNEFDYAIKSFRAFCSWGGSISDYRLLAPYLSNRFIMAQVLNNLKGFKNKFDEKKEKVVKESTTESLQVFCENLICRKVTRSDFEAKFPQSVGSTGLSTDLDKLYCHHFRFQDFNSQSTIPAVKEWIKKTELEDSLFETSFFISLMTGVPDPFMGITSYTDVPFIAKSSVDERWNQWARNVLGNFSRDLLFEESFKVRAEPRREILSLMNEGLKLKFNITLGEMDRLMDDTDKLGLSFNLRLSKNYLRQMRNRWTHLINEVDMEGQRQFKQEISQYIGHQLKEKEKLFYHKLWNQDFSRLIADELTEQLFVYKGTLFDSYKDQMVAIPVQFSYGVFAIGYLRYRADLKPMKPKTDL